MFRFRFRGLVLVQNVLVCAAAFALMPGVVNAIVAGQVKGAQKSPLLSPGQFIGKSVDDCEKLLGAAVYLAGPGTPNQPKDMGNMVQHRFYKAPGFTRVILRRRINNAIPHTASTPPEQIPIEAEVYNVEYQIPKGRVATWQAAFRMIGLSTQGVTVESYPTKHLTFKIPGGNEGYWTPAGAHAGVNNNYFVKSKEDHILVIYKPSPEG